MQAWKTFSIRNPEGRKVGTSPSLLPLCLHLTTDMTEKVSTGDWLNIRLGPAAGTRLW